MQGHICWAQRVRTPNWQTPRLSLAADKFFFSILKSVYNYQHKTKLPLFTVIILQMSLETALSVISASKNNYRLYLLKQLLKASVAGLNDKI